MYTTFAHGNDSVVRTGDFVATRDPEQWNRRSATPDGVEALQRKYRNVPSRTDCHLKRPSSRTSSTGKPKSRTSRSPSVASPAMVSPVAQHNSMMKESPTAQEFDCDISSIDTWWKSMTRGTWLCEEARHTHLIGVVDSVDETSRSAVVTVWRRGEDCDISSKKTKETVPLHLLKKLTPQEFHKLCRSKFMHDMSHQLKLRGEGYDESAPLALIAYNNRIISNLIDKIDTTADLSKLTLQRRPKGMRALREMPIPTIVPVEDPLAEARDELRALAAGGMMAKKRPGGKASKDPSLMKREEDELKDVRCVASRGSTRPGTTTSMSHGDLGGTSQSAASPALSHSQSQSHQQAFFLTEGPRSAIQETIGSAANAARGELASRLGRAREEAQRATIQVYSGAASPPNLKSPRKDASDHAWNPNASGVQQPPALSSPGSPTIPPAASTGSGSPNAGKDESLDGSISCVLVDVSDDGKLLLRPRHGGALFIGKLANVQLFFASQHEKAIAQGGSVEEDALTALRNTKQLIVDVKVEDRDTSGSALVTIALETGDSLQEALVANGVATVCCEDDSIFDALNPAYNRKSNRQAKLDRLRRSEEVARKKCLGLWANPLLAALFHDGDISPERHGDRGNSPSKSPPRPGNANSNSDNSAHPHQSSASKNFLGATGGSHNLFGRSDFASSSGNSNSARVVETSSVGGDSRSGSPMDVVDDDPSDMPPLFTAFQSSAKFRQRLLQTVNEGNPAAK